MRLKLAQVRDNGAIDGETAMKKNCFNCKELTEDYEHDSDGHEIGGGYFCGKQYEKAAQAGQEIKYERNMERKEYLEKGKVCFEAREQPNSEVRG